MTRNIAYSVKGRDSMFKRDPKTAKIGEEILPLDMGYLPEFFKKKAEVELNYTPLVRERSLRELKEAIANDKTLRSLEFTDEAFLIFLNSRKYDLKRTILQLKKCVTFRKNYPEYFTNVKFEDLSVLLSSEFFTILPWRCQDGCALCIVNVGNYNPQTLTFMKVLKMSIVFLTQTLRDPMNHVNGFKVIYDMNIGVDILKVCNPHNLYLLHSVGERVLAARLKEYHIVNMGVAGRTAFHIMKMFMSEKMKERIHIHQSNDTLLNFLPKAILPVKYGGDLQVFDETDWVRKITSPEELAALNIISS